MSYRLCIIFEISIVSPRRRLYDNEGSFSNFNLSIIPGNSFVALFWMFSIAIICFVFVRIPHCYGIVKMRSYHCFI